MIVQYTLINTTEFQIFCLAQVKDYSSINGSERYEEHSETFDFGRV